jgi:uncharacterized protein (TIGR00725 family)
MERTSWVTTYHAQLGLYSVNGSTEHGTKQKPLISIIGDSRATYGSDNYEMAYWLGYALVSKGYRFIVGGSGGIAEAASRGACIAHGYSDGDVINIFPGYHPCDPGHFRGGCMSFSNDLYGDVIVTHSDAVVAIAGGSGTLTQLAHAWGLNKLIIAYQVKGWSGRVANRPMDARKRNSNIPDDRVYGVTLENEVLDKLELLGKYVRAPVSA